MRVVKANEPDTHVQTSTAPIATDAEALDVSDDEYKVLVELYNSTCDGVAACKWSYPVRPVCDGSTISCDTTGAIIGMYFWL